MSLTQDQRDLCEGILIKNECFYALSHMKSFKSPGIDGLPKEFYETFWIFGWILLLKWQIIVLEKISCQLLRELEL